jgi:hypothetical protein
VDQLFFQAGKNSQGQAEFLQFVNGVELHSKRSLARSGKVKLEPYIRGKDDSCSKKRYISPVNSFPRLKDQGGVDIQRQLILWIPGVFIKPLIRPRELDGYSGNLSVQCFKIGAIHARF